MGAGEEEEEDEGDVGGGGDKSNKQLAPTKESTN